MHGSKVGGKLWRSKAGAVSHRWRTFDGHKFELYAHAMTQASARETADYSRRSGHKVRVTKESSNDFIVWRRK